MKGYVVLFLLAVSSVHAQNGGGDSCPPEQETNWEIEWLLRHDDCHKFYKCTFGQPIEYICPSDLYFNLDTWQCDWQENVDCEGRNDPALTTTVEPSTTTTPTTTTTTTPAPTTTTTTTTTPAPTTTTTTTTPAPTTTTTTTTTPAPTTTTTTTTTPAPTTTTTTTTTPAPTTTTTTTTTPAPTTSTTTTTTPAPTTTSTTTTAEPPTTDCVVVTPTQTPEEFLPNGCPVDPHIHWLLPNSENCSLFYYCVWGELVLRECPPTLYFNPDIQVCDYPQNAGCAVSANKHSKARRRLLEQILN